MSHNPNALRSSLPRTCFNQNAQGPNPGLINFVYFFFLFFSPKVSVLINGTNMTSWACCCEWFQKCTGASSWPYNTCFWFLLLGLALSIPWVPWERFSPNSSRCFSCSWFKEALEACEIRRVSGTTSDPSPQALAMNTKIFPADKDLPRQLWAHAGSYPKSRPLLWFFSSSCSRLQPHQAVR